MCNGSMAHLKPQTHECFDIIVVLMPIKYWHRFIVRIRRRSKSFAKVNKKDYVVETCCTKSTFPK